MCIRDSSTINNELKRIFKQEFNITDISSHSLRHTFGTRCIESGMAPVVVQRLMGHKDIAVTLNTYTSVLEQFKEREFDKVNPVSYTHLLYKHNERKNTNYSNKDINKNNSINNYSIKQCNTTYSKAIKQLIAENDLKCRITSYTNLVCEFIITSDKEFFDSIGENETKRYFQTAYNFVANYKNLGRKYILSAKVHMDERTPNLHLVIVDVYKRQLFHSLVLKPILQGYLL